MFHHKPLVCESNEVNKLSKSLLNWRKKTVTVSVFSLISSEYGEQVHLQGKIPRLLKPQKTYFYSRKTSIGRWIYVLSTQWNRFKNYNKVFAKVR